MCPLSLEISQEKVGSDFVDIAHISGNPDSSNLENVHKEIAATLRECKCTHDLVLDCEHLLSVRPELLEFVDEWSKKLDKKNHRLITIGLPTKNKSVLSLSNLQQVKAVLFKNISSNS